MIAPARARWIGSTIAGALAIPASGAVAAVFARSCYLDLEQRIVALVHPDLGRGPLNVVTPPVGLGLAGLAVGTAVRVEPPEIMIAPDVRIDLSEAQIWNARLPSLSAASLHRRGIERIKDVLAGAPPESLARPAARPARALEGMDALYAGLRSGDPATVAAAASRLAGLGPGLTPSGDDLLVGALIAAALVHPRRAAAVGGEVLKAAGGRTTRISLAYLEAASRGEASEAWHGLARALDGGSDDAIAEAATRAMATGETSGADMLTGFLLALEAWHGL